MNSYEISFKKDGYDPFVDYMKGVCILCVVMAHAISKSFHDASLLCLWGDMQVPLFLLIQCLHQFKKSDVSMPNWRKMWKRIIKPFLIAEVLLFILGVLLTYFSPNGKVSEFVQTFAQLGGTGRGCYYPKMYIEFAILIPLFFPSLRNNRWLMGGAILLISILSEIVFSTYDIYILWQWVCFRYLFIIFLAYIVATVGIKINLFTIMLSILSCIMIMLFQYSNIDFEPLFYDNPWRIYHWPVYFWMAFALIPILYYLYRIKTAERIKGVIISMGKYSYEIFLFQMLVFFCSDTILLDRISQWGAIVYLLYAILLIIVCIYPILWYKKHEEKKSI
jgi:hypothetical protein